MAEGTLPLDVAADRVADLIIETAKRGGTVDQMVYLKRVVERDDLGNAIRQALSSKGHGDLPRISLKGFRSNAYKWQVIWPRPVE